MPDEIEGTEFRKGGIKLWMYRENKGIEYLTVNLNDAVKGKTVSSFQINLNFKDWRAVWVSFQESMTQERIRPPIISQLDIIFPQGTDIMYFDLLEFSPKLMKQSRDSIVPTMNEQYGLEHTWQQTYKWSVQRKFSLPDLNTEKLEDLEKIDSKLENWYVDRTKSTYELTGHQRKRWLSLLADINTAHDEFGKLGATVSGFIRNPLFALNSDYGKGASELKFGDVNKKILFPLVMEYYLRTRDVEINWILANLGSDLLSRTSTIQTTAIEAIAGSDASLQNKLMADIQKYNDVRMAMNNLDKERLSRIDSVLCHLNDQGWAEGSGLGSLDHEMNRNGAFLHAIYLLKTAIGGNSYSNEHCTLNLASLIKTAKWYCEFGEVYQNDYEYAGTTADRVKALVLYRLMIVLLMPSRNELEQREKLRDMDALKGWINNALTINKALGGFIKPDFTAFHHYGFYASAYVPHALHTAAMVHYLLAGTSFELDQVSVRNVKKALETLRIVAVKYSTPNSLSGRFPNYTRGILSQIIPAYAYITEVGLSRTSPATPGMFKRLCDANDPVAAMALDKVKIKSLAYFMDSIGAVDVMEARSGNSEDSPKGHWAKNFAALSIHRRNDWAVTMKGLNNFVWDYEHKGSQENAFGLFQSHGALLIANSEDALKTHNIAAGWDWTRIPGTTTIALTLDELKTEGDRYFNREQDALAGGVSFQGSRPTISESNGVFGMNFKQPKYKNTFLDQIEFEFRKSVFFFDNLLVCLGSNIKVKKTSRKVQTTLFQDKLVHPTNPSYIEVDGSKYLLNERRAAFKPSSIDTKLIDTNGNGYFIPNSGSSDLNLHIDEQSSKKQNGVDSKGTYATAWLEHSQHGRSSYEYAVLVDASSSAISLDGLAAAQTSANKFYEVLQRNASAHVVKFNRSPFKSGPVNPTHGYVLFSRTWKLPSAGPIKKVTSECLLMVEETPSELYLAISYPKLDFNGGRAYSYAHDFTVKERYYVVSGKKTIKVTLTYDQGKVSLVKAYVKDDVDYKPNVVILSKDDGGKKVNQVIFNDLTNGFTVEVLLKKISVIA